MANKTKIIEYSYLSTEDHGHGTRVETKKAIFLDPEDNEHKIGFLVFKSRWGNGPLVVYLTKKVEEIRTFCFRNDLDIDEFPIPGQPNVDRWDQVKILSPVNLLSDEYCEILVSNFQITMSCFDVKKSIWDIFKDKL
ncbi:MAG: hypothetical protein AAB679_01160 [Patescibacteria group bacterium]